MNRTLLWFVTEEMSFPRNDSKSIAARCRLPLRINDSRFYSSTFILGSCFWFKALNPKIDKPQAVTRPPSLRQNLRSLRNTKFPVQSLSSSMAQLIRPSRKPLLRLSSSSASSSSSTSKILPSQLEQQQQQQPRISLLNPNFSLQSPRTYISEMRRSTFEGNLLRLLRNEIRYELDRSPVNQPVTKFESFLVDDRPGEQWISLSRKFGDKEDIKVEATMIDGALRDPKSSGGAVAGEEDVSLHITLIINISKEGSDNVLEFVCSAWSDCLEVDKVSIRKRGNMSVKPYDGPEYKDLDDQLDDAIHEYLEERGINDKLAAFVHEYVKNKDKTEFIRWMETVKSFIEKN